MTGQVHSEDACMLAMIGETIDFGGFKVTLPPGKTAADYQAKTSPKSTSSTPSLSDLKDAGKAVADVYKSTQSSPTQQTQSSPTQSATPTTVPLQDAGLIAPIAQPSFSPPPSRSPYLVPLVIGGAAIGLGGLAFWLMKRK